MIGWKRVCSFSDCRNRSSSPDRWFKPVVMGALVAALLGGLASAEKAWAAAPLDYLYWTVTKEAEVWRARSDGSASQRIAATNGLFGLEVDLINNKLYYGDDEDALYSADLDGMNQETLVVGTGRIWSIRLDPAGKVYWVESDNKRIRRADIDGSNVETLAAGLGLFPTGLAIDPSAGRIFFERGNNVDSANLDGSDRVMILNNLGTNLAHVAVDPVNQKVYVSSLIDGIRWANYDGSDLASLISGNVQVLLVHGAKVYFLGGGGVRSMDLDGGNLQTISTGISPARWFRLDLANNLVYFLDPHLVRTTLDGLDLASSLGATRT